MLGNVSRGDKRFFTGEVAYRCAFTVLLLWAYSRAFASPVLLRAPKRSVVEPASVVTYGGAAKAVVSPVRPGNSLTVVWLLDTLDESALDQARVDFLALSGQMRGRSLRLALFQGDSLDVLGPFTSRSQMQRALSGVEAPSSRIASPAALDALHLQAGRLGARWSPVLLVGTLPKMDSETEAYAQALLGQSFATQQIRVFLLSATEDDEGWSALFASTGGSIVASMDELRPVLDEVSQAFVQVTWAAAEPSAGFVVSSAVMIDAEGQTLSTAPDLVTAGGGLPTIEAYATMQGQMKQATAWLQEPLTTENLTRIRDVLLPAQGVNPIDQAVLKTEIELGEKTQDYAYAVKAATLLSEVRPEDGSALYMLGKARVLAGAFEQAETALNRAAKLKYPADKLAEEYARVRLGRKDNRGALAYLAQALKQDGNRQDLWFLQARAAVGLHESVLAIRSFEQGLALGGLSIDEREALIRLYLEAEEPGKAHDLALHTIAMLPTDPAVRSRFAETLDGAKMPVEALAAWKSVLAVEPDAERGHVRVAQLLLETGDRKGAEAAAGSSLQNLPNSGALYLAKSDAIWQQGRIYDARSTLEEGAAGTHDPAVLLRLANAQEVYGDRAPEAYAHLADVLLKGTPERFHALERGFSLALRDGNLKQAGIFAGLLESEGHPEFRVLLGEKRAARNDAMIPGGLAAFALVARIKQNTPPERFFAEYAHQVVRSVCTSNCMGDHYSGIIQAYFATIAELEGMGRRDGSRVTIVVSLNGKDERRRTENVLKLLGLQMRTDKGQVRLERGEKQSQSKKQDILAALEIDEVGLEDALRTGKPFEFKIHDEPAAVYPSAKMWKESFPKLDQSQFALMLLHAPLMARLYVGMSTLDRRTVQALIGTSGLYWFMGRAADLLSQYGTSFAVEGTHAAVPGGAVAEPVWSAMVGVGTDKPGAFYQALLEQKSPSLLAYFFAISHLDSQHQAFFTANLTRAKRFYALFATLPESQAVAGGTTRDSPLNELLSAVPIDDDGHVAFPGSAEVWTIAKGNSADDKRVAKMMKKVSRAAAPDVEDEVLLHLADTRYKAHSTQVSELDNFLAVAHIDAHREKPLDEESALMLAQHYGDSSSAYPYFADLTAIDTKGLRSFFSLVDGLARQPVLEQQLAMGQIHSLIEWVVLMKRRHVINDSEAARLFDLICSRFSAASDEELRTEASIDLAGAILGDCGHNALAGWDDRLRGCLLGDLGERGDQRAKDFQIVLDEQKVPSLETLRLIVMTARSALNGAAPLKVALLSVPLPSEVKIGGKEKEAMLLYDPSRLQKLIEQWNQNAGKTPQNGKTAQTAQKLAVEMLKAVEPQTTLALAGPIYAYFFRSGDRVVSDDALLLRKHRYIEFLLPSEQHRLLRESGFVVNSDGFGSHLEGGFAQFGLASGFAVASGWKQGGLGGPAVVAEQVAAIRSATWDLLLEGDQRLVTLRILAAREWIVGSAMDSKLFVSLAEETSGLLSLSRRADLLNGIEERDWQQVWTSITLPDLFRLGGSYLRRRAHDSLPTPVSLQLKAVSDANDGSRLDIVGRIPNHVLGCGHTHLVADAPYEEYERQLLPTYMAERTAEFKIFLAYRADSLGVQPAELPQAAEKLAAKAFTVSRMTDYHDWRSLLSAYASITNNDLKNALEP